jgi:hypothetical protein
MFAGFLSACLLNLPPPPPNLRKIHLSFFPLLRRMYTVYIYNIYLGTVANFPLSDDLGVRRDSLEIEPWAVYIHSALLGGG